MVTHVDEHGLADFRRRQLSPEAILANVEKDVAVLYRLPVGVGKSTAVDDLLTDHRLYAAFDFVLYAAPTWNIIRERAIVTGQAPSPVPWMLLEPRPVDRCGDYAAEWKRLESQGCSTFAKAKLCRQCRDLDAAAEPCSWPLRMEELKRHQLLLLTEQQLVVNRSLVPLIRMRLEPGRILVILDEARFLDSNFQLSVSEEDLAAFREVLAETPGAQDRQRWLASIDALRATTDPGTTALDFPPWLNRDAYDVQETGLRKVGPSFRYLGYDLVLLGAAGPEDRWKSPNGAFHFVARPYLKCHLLLLSAHLAADYAGDRLGRGPLCSPFENTRFQHSGTRVFNIRSRVGADRYFGRNHKQILDTFAVLVARNVTVGRSTLLVSRKKSKRRCATYLQRRLAAWGHDVRLVTDKYGELPTRPDPRVIPVIHYGILGVNDFADYEAAYCLNSYYVSSRELTRAAQEAVPKPEHRELVIDSRPDGIRRVKVAEGPDPGATLAHIGNLHLRKLEVDPVIQAVGRVRLITRPREVVLFQMNDLSPDLGPYEDVRGMRRLREALDLPSAAELDHARDLTGLRHLQAQGLTVARAASLLGISRATAFRRLSAAESLTEPLKYISSVCETVVSQDRAEEAP